MMTTVVVLGAGILGGIGMWMVSDPAALSALAGRLKEAVHRWERFRWRERIIDQWPDGLTLLSGAVKAGLTLDEALTVLMTESPQPLRNHIARLLGEASHWLPFQVRVQILFKDPSLSLARATLLLSHAAGGRAADLLESCARILRRKSELREKARMLTAQARLTAWVVGLSPFVLMALLQVLSPELIRPFFASKAGLFLLALVILLVTAGLWTVHVMAKGLDA